MFLEKNYVSNCKMKKIYEKKIHMKIYLLKFISIEI